MTHLSSCYFCGSAVETPVRRYALPAGESETTLTLCPTCSEKLGIVLDTAGAGSLSPAGDVETTTLDPSEEGDEPHPSTEPPGETAGGDGSAERTAGTEEPVESATEAVDAKGATGPRIEDRGGDDPAGGSLDDPFEDEELLPDEDPLAGGSGQAAGGDSGDEVGDDPADEAGGDSGPLEDSDDRPDPSRDAAGTPDEPEPSPEQRTGDGETTREEGTDSTASEESEAEETGDESATATGESASDRAGAASTGISALEYNRVMRMLQNREFPVDREEILTVASSAYDLSREECAQVVDLAVERGLLEERDGELHRPPE